ncbi:cytochrome P450 family protein [Pleurotus pulmonarius]
MIPSACCVPDPYQRQEWGTQSRDQSGKSSGVTSLCWTLRKGRPVFPPGPPRAPIVGNLFDIPVDTPWVKFAEWGKVYGDVMYLRVFGRNLLVISSLEAAIDLFEKRSAIYSDRPKRVMGQLCGFGPLLIMSKYHQGVRAARRMLQGQVSVLGAARHQHLQEQVAQAFARSNLDEPENFLENIRSASASEVLSMAYGHQLKRGNEADDRLLNASKAVMRYLADSLTPNNYLVDAVPILRFLPKWFPGTNFHREAEKCRGLLKMMVHDLYDEVVEKMDNGTASTSYVQSVLKEKGGKLSAEEVNTLKWSAGDLFGAGSETTMATLENFFLVMTLHPEVQEKAQKELDAIVGNGRLPTFRDRPYLPYINCIIKEIWRWNTAVPFAGHSLSKDDEYRGYLIPADTVVMVNNWALTHNEEWYPDPTAFKPERHMQPLSGRSSLPQLPKYPPDPRTLVFGFGRRNCPGIHLAESFLYIVVVTTLATFSILPELDAEGNALPPKVEHLSGAISHPKPYNCRIVPRSPGAAEVLLLATS